MTVMDKTRVRKDAVAFDLILVGFFLLLSAVSLGYNPRARSIPLVLGVLGAVMAFLQFIVDAFPGMRGKLRFVGESGILGDHGPVLAVGKIGEKIAGGATEKAPVSEAGKTVAGEWWTVFRVLLWLVLFIVLLDLTHYLLAVGAFIFLITKIEAGESWITSISLALGLDASFFILFDLLLKASL